MHATQSHGTRGLPTIARRVGASMHPCMNSSTWHKPRLSDINIRSVITIQVTDLSGKAAVKMQPLISPLCHQSESCRMMALWPLDHETSDVIARDWDRNSKIRARHEMRNEESYNYISGCYSVMSMVRPASVPQKSRSRQPPRPRSTGLGATQHRPLGLARGSWHG